MFSLILGLPGRFTLWCEQVVATLVEGAGGSNRLLQADALEAFALAATESGQSDAAAGLYCPGGGLRAAMIEQGRNFVVAIEDPRTVLAELAFGRDVSWADAVQQVASSCAALCGLSAAPGALALNRDRDWPQAEKTAAAIAGHLRLPFDKRTLPGLQARIAAQTTAAQPYDAVARWEALSVLQQELARGALGAFVDRNDTDKPGPVITWGPELFFTADQPQRRLDGPIDITGRARCLMQGPGMMLPPGFWSLTLTGVFTHSAAEHEFFIEVDADVPLVSGTIRPEREGSASITLDFQLDELNERTLTLRLSSRRAAFDGAITLIGATLVRWPAQHAAVLR
jgi:hypothetical protein